MIEGLDKELKLTHAPNQSEPWAELWSSRLFVGKVGIKIVDYLVFFVKLIIGPDRACIDHY